ncbi:MAG: extracellular solute-binding protein [Ilumatobacteraceae bacterium]
MGSVPTSAAGRWSEATVIENYGEDGAGLGAIDGTQYAVPYRATVKSLVWYRPDVFADRDWTIPTTLDELTVLVERIAADGELAPWCLGINAGSATGWAATDWTEDLVLRSIGPDRYQQWATGEIEFADPAIADAFAQFRALTLDPGRTLGGIRGIVETPVDQAILPLLDETPGCAMHRQADSAANWIPDGTTIGPDGDVDVFVLPGITDSAPPLVVGGTQAVQFQTDNDTNALLNYLASAEAATIWARQGGFISLNHLVPDDAYPDDHFRQLTAAIDQAPAIVFDASDQMPPAIGADLLWDEITAWVAGTDDYPTFASNIDNARAANEPPPSDS